jgi:type I restriction enzyme, S subunit
MFVESELGEFLELITYGFTNPMPDADEGPWKITAKDVINGRVNFDSARRTTLEAFQNDLTDKSRPIVGDILLTKDGTLGRLAVVKEEGLCVNQSVAVLRPNGRITSTFLYYLLASPSSQNKLIADSDGSVLKHIYITRVPKMVVSVPTIKDQKAIAHILGTLDDKIELNQKMNQTLEEIAKAIFKSWFVDFDPVRAKAEGRPTGLPPEVSDLFPDELVDSEIGEIPKGWEVAKLAKICETTDYVANGSFSTLKENVSKVESFSGTEAMMLRFADFNRGWTGDFSFVTHDSYEFLSKSKVFCGDIVICNVGEVGAVFRAPDLGFDMTLGPNGVLCKNFESGIGLKREYFYFYLSDKTFRSRIEAISSGSVQTKFNKTDFRNLDVLIPHHELLAVADPIFEQVCQRLDLLFKENRILSELRDTLLPKLISGELRIPDAEKFFEEADI